MSDLDPLNNATLAQLRIEWVDPSSLRPNEYNPNEMAAEDLDLLRQSVIEDGWTQPIVTLPDGTIVDGEHRWRVASLPLSIAELETLLRTARERSAPALVERCERGLEALRFASVAGTPLTVAMLTGGLIPRTVLDLQEDAAHQRITTVRHNRARGDFRDERLAALVTDLTALGLDADDLLTRLGMPEEEVEYLLSLTDEVEQVLAEMSPPPTVTLIQTAPHWDQDTEGQLLNPVQIEERELHLSKAAAEAAKEHQKSLLERQQQAERLRQEAIEAATAGKVLSEDERVRVAREVERTLPPTPPPPPAPMKKRIAFYMTEGEYEPCARVMAALSEQESEAFLMLCQEAWLRMFPDDPYPDAWKG